jgi:hypothetical protein
MFDHVSIGVRDLARAKRFYDAALRPLGYVCLSENADALGYGRDKIGLWIGTAARPVPSDTASNLHFCFTAPTREAVDAFHVAALSTGGAAWPAPGLWHGLLRSLRGRHRRVSHRGLLRRLGCLGGIQAPLLTRAFHTRASPPLARQVACPHRGLARKPQGSARASAMRIARSQRLRASPAIRTLERIGVQ